MKSQCHHLFSVVNYGESHQFICTKTYSLQLNKYWGYIINININKVLEELQGANKLPLEHMLNNHENCQNKFVLEYTGIIRSQEIKKQVQIIMLQGEQ